MMLRGCVKLVVEVQKKAQSFILDEREMHISENMIAPRFSCRMDFFFSSYVLVIKGQRLEQRSTVEQF
jgi:hypothetical protein